MYKKFISLNKTACARLYRYLPQAKKRPLVVYEKVVTEYLNAMPHKIVLDVGGGEHCPFALQKDSNQQGKIIAVDILEEKIRGNRDVDEKLIANIMQPLPFKENQIDFIVSRSVLEHLKDLEAFIVESKRVLKSKGYCIHVFPSKFAPFAIINQLLPQGLSKKLLFFVRPEVKHCGGFPAYYSKCFYSSIKALFQKYGYEIVTLHLGYFQASYFSFFLPLFLMVAVYEMLVQFIRAKNLCAYILIVAKKL